MWSSGSLLRGVLVAVFLIIAGLCTSACDKTSQGVNWDAVKGSVQLEGDLRCEGSGQMGLMGFVVIKVDGGAGLQGEHGTEDEAEYCAGLRVTLGPWQWIITAPGQGDNCPEGIEVIQLTSEDVIESRLQDGRELISTPFGVAEQQ